MDVNEQVRKLQEFIESKYHNKLLESAREGKEFLIIDFSELSHFDPELANYLLDYPDEVIKSAQIAVENVEAFPDSKNFNVRFNNLPKSQKVMIKDIRSKHLNKFLMVEGLVKQKSDVRPQVTLAKFECPGCGNIISVYQVDSSFKEPTKCSCGKRRSFKILDKELVDAQRIVMEESPEDIEGGEQPKRMSVMLKSDLVSPMSEKKTNPGSKINVTGIVKEVPITLKTGAKSTTFDLFIDANYIEGREESFGDIQVTKEEEEEILAIAADERSYEKMVNSIAPSIYGHDKVKEALLLQLMGGVRKKREDGVITRGDIHVLLVGDPGAGKCVDGDTKIILDNGEIQTIKNFTEGENNFQELPSKVLSINENGLIHNSRPVKFWKRQAPKEMIKIITGTGNELIVTKDHPLFTTNDGLIFAKKTEDFKKHDYLALPSKININGSLQIIPLEIIKSRARNKVKYSVKEIFDYDFARLMGYLVGDGYVRIRKTTGITSLTNKNKDVLNDFERLVKNVFNLNVIKRKKQNSDCFEYYITSIEIVRILLNIDPSITCKSGEMKISSFVTKSPDKIVKGFIQSLFECEAYVSKTKRVMEFSSKSKELIFDLKYLLLRFGIISQVSSSLKYASNTKNKTKNIYYRLRISGKEIINFYEKIGFISSEKQNKLRKINESQNNFNTNIDVVPNLKILLKVLREKYGLNQNSFGIIRSTYQHYEKGDRNPSYHNLKKICEKYSQISCTKEDPLVEILNQISSCDIFWDKIKSIEIINYENELVYDLEINKVHNFIANGVVVHNSQLLKRISNVAPKCRYVSGKGVSGAGLTATVVRDEFLKGWSLEAGALALTNGGYCLIDELDKMTSEDRDAMHEALEQQSYHYDTEINFANGSKQKIGALIDHLMENHKKEIVQGLDCEILNKKIELITTDFKSIFPVKTVSVSRHQAPEYFIEIDYSNGRKITVTPEHPIFVFDNEIKNINAENIKKGMFAPAPRKIPFKGEKKEIKLNESEINGKQLSSFLGYFVTEGHSYYQPSNYYAEIGISNTDPLINFEAKHLMTELFNKKINENIRYSEFNDKATKDLITTRVCSVQIYKWFKSNFKEIVNKATTKRVPEYIMSSNQENKLCFLRTAFKGDGFVDSERFGLCTSSFSLAKDYQDLLLNFGIYCYISKSGENSFKIVISGRENMIKFVDLFVDDWDNRLDRLSFFINRSGNKKNDRDIIPNLIVEKIKKLLLQFKLDDGGLNHAIINKQNIHRRTAKCYLEKIEKRLNDCEEEFSKFTTLKNKCNSRKLRKKINIELKELSSNFKVSISTIRYWESKNKIELINFLNKKFEEKINESQQQLEEIKKTVCSDIGFIKVKSVKKIINKDQKWVYDIHVEPTHNFISEGLILHNSISIAKANIQATLRAETTVLAAANPKFGRFAPYDPVAKQIDLPPTLISRFDLIFPIKDLPNEARDASMAEFILKLHQNKEAAQGDYNTRTIKTFIAYARQQIAPVLTEDALKEIRDYYVKMRGMGKVEGEVVSIPITARQLEALVRLSEASAKTRLSKKVLKSDAMRAIELLDYCLKLVGMDKETGTLDIDRISIGMGASQRNKIQVVRIIIEQLEESTGKEISMKDVIERCREKNISSDEVEEIIEKLKRLGDIYEPTRGRISRVL